MNKLIIRSSIDEKISSGICGIFYETRFFRFRKKNRRQLAAVGQKSSGISKFVEKFVSTNVPRVQSVTGSKNEQFGDQIQGLWRRWRRRRRRFDGKNLEKIVFFLGV